VKAGRVSLKEFAQRGCSYSFLDLTLNLATERLVRGTSEIKLRPKSFHLLRYLVEHHRRLPLVLLIASFNVACPALFPGEFALGRRFFRVQGPTLVAQDIVTAAQPAGR